MLISEADDRFYIADSTLEGAGIGVFAKTPLATGEALEVIGVLVPADSASDRCTRYADAYKFRVGDYLLIPVGYGGLVNHSSAPNMEKVIEGRRVLLRAVRDIKKREELLFSYSEYAQKRFGLRKRA